MARQVVLRSVFRLLVPMALLGAGMVQAVEPVWADHVDLWMVFQGTAGEDYSRPNPPFRRHVWFDVTWENKSEKVVTGIEFRMRFIDAFGDILHTSEVLKDSNRIGVGQSSSILENKWYYEDSILGRDSLYSLLAPGAAADTLRIHVAVLRVAFGDGTVISFEEQFAGDFLDPDRAAARRQRLIDESPWRVEDPIYLVQTDQFLRTEPFTITTPEGNLRLSATGSSAEIRLSVLVYDESGNVVASSVFDEPLGTGTFWAVGGDIPVPAGTYVVELNPTMADEVNLRVLEAK
jgi:hypothetical protein